MTTEQILWNAIPFLVSIFYIVGYFVRGGSITRLDKEIRMFRQTATLSGMNWELEIKMLRIQLDTTLYQKNLMQEEVARLRHELHMAKIRLPQVARNQTLKAPDDMMKRIRMLCHPDKHKGSEMSQKVFTWLESQR